MSAVKFIMEFNSTCIEEIETNKNVHIAAGMSPY